MAYNRTEIDQSTSDNSPSGKRGWSMVRQGRLRQRLNSILRQRRLSTSMDSSTKIVSQSSWIGSWCIKKPAVLDDQSSNRNLSDVNSDLHAREHLGTSSSSSEITLSDPHLNEEILPNLSESTNSQEQSPITNESSRIMTDVCIDLGMSRDTPIVYDYPVVSSPIFSGPLSNSRARLPFLFGMAHRTQSFEMISSPLSYMSSPDFHVPNADIQGSYIQSFPSPNLSITTSSPEYLESSHGSFHVHSSGGTPIFQPFRPFAFQPVEENQECFTYGGLSEQVIMWETNLFLGGISSQDQYRDLRLDIDNMTYEDLLALEESIGSVSTGLQKDVIFKCLTSKKYAKCAINNSLGEDSQARCIICQVDFEEGSEIGTLQCGHSHHFSCIQEWLLLKNQCPICKASAT